LRYTIEGFSQPRLVELGLGATEALLLRWLVDFSSCRILPEYLNAAGQSLWYVAYETIARDLPILGIQHHEAIARRFGRLVEAGVLIHECVRDGGTFSYYGFGAQYETLISDVSAPTVPSVIQYGRTL